MTEAREPDLTREDDVTADWRAEAAPGELPAWISVVPAIAERLTGVLDRAQLARAVEDELSAGLGASAVILAEAADGGAGFSPLVIEGVSDETRSWLSHTDRDPAWSELVAAVGERRPVFWSSIAERDATNPQFRGRRSTASAWAILPLVVRGAVIGAISIGWPEERSFAEPTRSLLTVVAHQCALALDRIRVEQLRRAERAALELLADSTRVMVSELEPDRVIDALVRLAVPRLAPWCAIYVPEDGVLRRVAIHIADDPELASELRDTGAVPIDAHQPLTEAFRAGSTLAVPIEERLVRAIYRRPHADRILRLGVGWTALAVPIKARGRVIGMMSLVSNRWGFSPPDDVRFVAEGLAARAGVALANARRFEEERATAALLMESILPASLPEVANYDVAARYLPAGSRVAGDWYDVAPLPSGRFLIGIGDVGGHGVVAASLMSRLRNSARGFGVVGYSPAAIVEALNAVTKDIDDCFATTAYAVLDTTEHTVRWSSAGHLPPLSLRTDGSAEYLLHRPAPPLGCDGPRPGEQRLLLEAPGAGIVLVTDGVVERRRRGLDEGMEQLRRLVEGDPGSGADKLVQQIAEELCSSPEDDCCIVVLRRR